jgi:hypothetical protein
MSRQQLVAGIGSAVMGASAFLAVRLVSIVTDPAGLSALGTARDTMSMLRAIAARVLTEVM